MPACSTQANVTFCYSSMPNTGECDVRHFPRSKINRSDERRKNTGGCLRAPPSSPVKPLTDCPHRGQKYLIACACFSAYIILRSQGQLRLCKLACSLILDINMIKGISFNIIMRVKVWSLYHFGSLKHKSLTCPLIKKYFNNTCRLFVQVSACIILKSQWNLSLAGALVLLLLLSVSTKGTDCKGLSSALEMWHRWRNIPGNASCQVHRMDCQCTIKIFCLSYLGTIIHICKCVYCSVTTTITLSP